MVQVATVVVQGAHGGAGVTTVTRLLDMQPAFEVQDSATPDVIVVVCRTTADSAATLPDQLAQLESRGLLGRTVVVALGDSLAPTPPAARARLSTARGLAAEVVRLPYVPAWRYAGHDAPTPARFDRQVTQLHAAALRAAGVTISARPGG